MKRVVIQNFKTTYNPNKLQHYIICDEGEPGVDIMGCSTQPVRSSSFDWLIISHSIHGRPNVNSDN